MPSLMPLHPFLFHQASGVTTLGEPEVSPQRGRRRPRVTLNSTGRAQSDVDGLAQSLLDQVVPLVLEAAISCGSTIHVSGQSGDKMLFQCDLLADATAPPGTTVYGVSELCCTEEEPAANLVVQVDSSGSSACSSGCGLDEPAIHSALQSALDTCRGEPNLLGLVDRMSDSPTRGVELDISDDQDVLSGLDASILEFGIAGDQDAVRGGCTGVQGSGLIDDCQDRTWTGWEEQQPLTYHPTYPPTHCRSMLWETAWPHRSVS